MDGLGGGGGGGLLGYELEGSLFGGVGSVFEWFGEWLFDDIGGVGRVFFFKFLEFGVIIFVNGVVYGIVGFW